MSVLVAHPGTQHSYRLAAELQRHQSLAAFYTGMAFPAGGMIDIATRMMSAKCLRRVASRRIRGVPSARLHRRPFSELAAMWRLRRGGDGQNVWHRRSEAFQRSISTGALSAASAVIGFDTASWVLAEHCQQLSIPFVLDQTTAHPDAKLPVYTLVQQQYPTWNNDVEIRRPDVRAAEQQEHDGAKLIVAGSSFVKETLTSHGVLPEKIRVNPYGVDCQLFHIRERHKLSPLRFIFVGGINARKGVPLLLDAWRNLSAAGAELWIVGRASPAVQALLPELPGSRYLGAVPHGDLPALMQQCDVFVFPSYFEGLALVNLEAMACGLPVITTSSSGAVDVLTNGEDGWIIQPGDLTALEEKLNYCLEHPEVVREMGLQARATAERFTWSAYGDRWMEILAEL